LHHSGFVHRDIKPENLLINKDLKLVIADFNFAARLDRISPSSFSPLVSHDYLVGSETYNAPELWNDSTQNGQQYDGIKSDSFAAAATLFILTTKLCPFRRAQLNDPYYKRLAHKDKRYFWKIYEGYPTTALFRDLFEKMTSHEPKHRITLDEALIHKFFFGPIDE
jgi:3-phosphoinositide dependent protein kinase-1